MAELHRRGAASNRPTTYGSLAYDLDALVRERQLDEAGAMPERKAAPAPQMQRRVKPQAKARPSLLLLGGITALCAMVLVLLLGYVQLTEVSTRVGDIKIELSQLSDEHVSLLTEYEKTYDLATVKAKAEAAGMSKPTSGQIEYIELTGTDSVILYDEELSPLKKTAASIGAGVRSVWEYFR